MAQVYIYIYIYRSNIEQSIHIILPQNFRGGLCRTTDTIDFQQRFSTPPPTPTPPPPPVPNNQADSSFLHRVPPVGGGGGGRVGGGVMIPTNSTNMTTTTKAMSCNKIGQSIEHEEKYMANKRELSQFSIWRRDSSMLFLCEQQWTHANGT